METQRRGREGIHLAIDLSQGSALTWVAGELAVALADLGAQVSLPRVPTLSPTLEPRLQPRLAALMSDTPCRTYHVKLNHYWPQFLMQEVTGEINAELFVTNYRFRGGIHPLDLWSRNLVTNDARKLPLSSFCRDSLVDLGVPASRCSVVAPGYSPEIESLYPAGKPRDDSTVRRMLVVTNSHDLDRYGTDILIPALAKAFSANDPVEIHIKDYGAGCGSRVLRELIAAQPSFPKLVWHETFLTKSDLIRLYGEMHLLVAPFRGEGYAMKIIDAMALGLPVMMPAFGGPLEYAPAGGFLPLEFDEVPVGPCYDTEHYLVGPGAYWCEVREDALVESLRSYLRDPAAADDAAAVARAHVFSRYTWKQAAESLVGALHHWGAEKERKTARRRRPATLPLSVIMPTKDRPQELAKTIAGYAGQSDRSFELLLVNDHGDGDAVRRIAAAAGTGLRVRVLDNHGPPGPGAARNLALEAAEGELFLITGDDIVPARDLVARHREAHGRGTDPGDAFVGRIDWHPDLAPGWFMQHIVGMGGQQFAHHDCRDGDIVPFDRLYTCNVSWKRRLTADVEQIFSEAFRFAAFEDVELGYRLSHRGLRLRYLENAVAYHLHAMTPRSFFERMRRVGSMRTILDAMHPQLVGEDCLAFYRDLELERRRRIACGPPLVDDRWESRLAPLLAAFDDLDRRPGSTPPLSGAAAHQIKLVDARIDALRCRLFDGLCAAFCRLGQAEEWGRASHDDGWAMAWVAMLEVATRDSAARPALPPPRREPHPLKQAVLRFKFARAIREWLREAKQRRRAA
ncbi:MAG: glycosyltransferase [Planctomycetia bacterium]|nr:glycosyltransferase [Planctomycetia bacterium]